MATVKIYSTPSKLYRYRPLTPSIIEREIQAITEGYIWCPQFSSMNDPMEGVHRLGLSWVMNGDKTEKAVVRRERNKLGIASLSEVHDHEPMWAHYASQFQGMCVEYSTSKLLKKLPDNFDLVRMAYNEQPPILLADRSSTLDKAKLTLATKTIRWATEREWRLIIPEYGPAVYADAACITRIYLGSRVSAEAEQSVRQAAKPLKISVLKMMIDKYQISFSRDGKRMS
jgi:hypothetical protein